MERAEHVESVGCTVANVAGSGISIRGGFRNKVRSCDLFNLGAAGIQMSGGDLKSLTPAEHGAVNNHIHHYGLFQRTYAPGIGASGCGQIVRNNCIHDAPHNAILYSGNEHLFERNEIYRVVMETGDSGAFYSGRDWTSQGNQLRHNYIHDLGADNPEHVNTMGVYLDDCDSGDTIEGNVFYRAGRAIMIGGGRDNKVINNLVIDCPIGLHLDSRGMSWKQWNNPDFPGWNLEEKAEKLNYRNPPWSVRYPNLANIMNDSPREPLHNVIQRNIFVDCTKQVFNFDSKVKPLLEQLEIQDNIVVNRTGSKDAVAMTEDIRGFANVAGTESLPISLGSSLHAKQDLSLPLDSRLLKIVPSFESIPVKQIGLFKDDYRRELPAR
jgi:parallel beta-helix repeat protein